jgi:hypothetical protein
LVPAFVPSLWTCSPLQDGRVIFCSWTT